MSGSGSSLSSSSFSSSGASGSIPQGPTPRPRAKKLRPSDPEIVLLCKEFLACQAVSAESIAERLGEKHVIGVGLLNDDEGIVQATAHTIERMMVDFPPMRTHVLGNISRFLEEMDPRKASNLTLLSHLLAFLDLWTTGLFNVANSRSTQLLNEE
jgi:hypothetical protein